MFDALASIIGDIGGTMLQGNFNAREAEKNRNFQANMSNTARQRDVADLKAAGLNPVLAAGYGGTAPSGSTASISAPSLGSTYNSARGVSQQGALIKAQIEQAKSASALNLSTARKAAADTILTNQNSRRAAVEADAAEFLGGDLKGAVGSVHSARGVAEAGGSLWNSIKGAAKSATRYGRAWLSTK